MNKNKISACIALGLAMSTVFPSSAFALTSSTSGIIQSGEFSASSADVVPEVYSIYNGTLTKDDIYTACKNIADRAAVATNKGSYTLSITNQSATVTKVTGGYNITFFARIKVFYDGGGYDLVDFTSGISTSGGGQFVADKSSPVIIPPVTPPVVPPVIVQQQKVTDVYNQFNAIKDKIVASASTTADDIKNSVVVTNPSISVSVAAPSITPSTDKAEGRFQTTVNITDGTSNLSVFIDRPIAKLAQTAITAKSIIESTLPAMVATNNTTSYELESYFKNMVDTNSVSVSVPNNSFNKTLASEQNTGAVTAIVNLSDTVGNFTTVNLNLPIKTISQSLATVKSLFTNYANTFTVSNATTENDILSGVKITNQYLTTEAHITGKTNSTDTVEGNLSGYILIRDTSSGTTEQVNFNRVIPRLYLSATTAATKIKEAISKIEAVNADNVTYNVINAAAKACVDDMTTIGISNYKLVPSSEIARGSVQGTINIKDKIGGQSTVPINLVIDYLHQSIQTVAGLYVEAAKTYIPTNTTTAQDIIGMVSITNKDITVSPDSFKLIPATDESTGKVSVNLNIKEGNNSVVQPIQMLIQNQPQELSTALAEVQKYLANVKVDNSTDTDQLLIDINTAITNPDIFCSYSNQTGEVITKTNSTEDADGSIKGVLLLADSANHKVKVPVNLTINKLAQSLENAEQKVKEAIASMAVNNNTSEADVLFVSQNVVASNISVKIDNFKVNAASELEKGSITGTIQLSNGTESRSVELNKPIDLSAQTLETVYNLIDQKLKSMTLKNDSTSSDVKTALLPCLTGAAGSKIGIDVQEFNIAEATMDSQGYAEGKVLMWDSNAGIKYLPFKIDIKQLPQSVTHACNKLQEILNNYQVDNSITKEKLSEAMQKALTNAEGSKVTISLTQFVLDKATEENPGSLNSSILVTDGTESQQVPFNKVINQLSQSIETAKSNIEASLSSFKATNDTTEQDVLDNVKTNITNGDITIKFSTDEVDKFNIQKSTKETAGKITGTIIVSNSEGTSIKIPVNLNIDKLNQTVDEVKQSVQDLLKNFKPTNSTTEQDIIDAAKGEIKNPDITVVFKPEDPFKKNDSTTDNNGLITGTLVISDGKTTQELPINLTIDKLPQTVDQAKQNIQDLLKNFKPTNSTTAQDIIDAAKGEIKNPDITVVFKPEDPFKKNDSTTDNNGLITGTLVISDGKTTQALPINLTIDKLPQTVDQAKQNIEASLSSFKATNDTTEQDVLSKVKTNVQNENFTIVFGTSETEKFNIVKATQEAAGKITGTIIVSNATGESANVQVNLGIDKLQQTVDEAKQNIQDLLKNFKPTNSTTAQDIIDAAKGEIKNPDITVVFKPEDPFKKNDSTTDNNGLITGTLVISDGKTTQELAISIVIPKLPIPYVPTTEVPITTVAEPSSSGGSSGGGGGSSSSSSSSSSSDSINALVNPITNAIEENKNWKNVNGKWYYYNDKGEIQTGWINYNGVWYYLDSKTGENFGVMVIGWKLIDGRWYYFNSQGAMVIDWLNDNGTWYYLDPTPGTNLGVMVIGWKNINGTWYYLNEAVGAPQGSMKIGWFKDSDDKWYYLNSSGAMVTGWFNDTDGKWYYLNPNGSMAYDTTIDGYYLNNSGAWE